MGLEHTVALAALAPQVPGNCRELGLVQEPNKVEAQAAVPVRVEWHAEDGPPCVDPPDPRQERHHIQADTAAVAAELLVQDRILQDGSQQEVLCIPR